MNAGDDHERSSNTLNQKPLELDCYQRIAQQTDQNARIALDGLSFTLLGLFGEVGTLLSALKKKQRDRSAYVRYHDAVIEEFGDVLWYFCNVASRARVNLTTLAEQTFSPRSESPSTSECDVRTFADMQSLDRANGAPGQSFEAAAIRLAARVGMLVDDFSSGRLAAERELLTRHLIAILGAVVTAATAANVRLDYAAQQNVRKINSRWPATHEYPPLFDDAYPEIERLPRYIAMQIIEFETAGRTYVIQRCNGINIGSRLTDNKAVQDDYRFHDVFHLAYAAVLGWSPVIRALLNVKRKSRPEIDEAEDGARAALIEEGVSTLLFNYAAQLADLHGIDHLDYPMLKLVHQFVSGYEVQNRPLWMWEKAILDGFTVFRAMRLHRRGTVIADLQNRSIAFERLA